MVKRSKGFAQLLSTLFRAQPWHGVAVGENAPVVVNTYIEIVPTSTVKLKLKKERGRRAMLAPSFLFVRRIDRLNCQCHELS